jgi:hypothetical protein
MNLVLYQWGEAMSSGMLRQLEGGEMFSGTAGTVGMVTLGFYTYS